MSVKILRACMKCGWDAYHWYYPIIIITIFYDCIIWYSCSLPHWPFFSTEVSDGTFKQRFVQSFAIYVKCSKGSHSTELFEVKIGRRTKLIRVLSQMILLTVRKVSGTFRLVFAIQWWRIFVYKYLVSLSFGVTQLALICSSPLLLQCCWNHLLQTLLNMNVLHYPYLK